jgi:cytoskeletal protein RodZ
VLQSLQIGVKRSVVDVNMGSRRRERPKIMSSEQDNEALRSLGSDLKAVREAKGFSLKDVNDKTRISVTILNSIEKGDFHLLPPGVYARNFIRKYADFLGADSQSILEQLKREEERTAPPILKKETVGVSPVSDRRFWKYLAIGIAALLLIAILVWFLNSFWNADKPVGMPKISQGDVVDSATSRTMSSVSDNAIVKGDKVPPLSAMPPQATPDVLPSQATAAGNPQPPSLPNVPAQNNANVPAMVNSADINPQEAKGVQGPYRLIIEAKERTWLRIQTDNKETAQIMMRPGEKIERKAQDRFTLDIGNAAGVSVLFQGRKLENLGKQGQVVHLSLP